MAILLRHDEHLCFVVCMYTGQLLSYCGIHALHDVPLVKISPGCFEWDVKPTFFARCSVGVTPSCYCCMQVYLM